MQSTDLQLIHQIADRAADMWTRFGIVRNSSARLVASATATELNVVHTEIMPLRLRDLLDADDGNFAHDIAGIHRHLEHGTRPRLRDGFCPRFAR